MSAKTHCDLCDVVIGNDRGGHVDARPLHGLADGGTPMDLCLAHYNSYKEVVAQWKKFEGGFVPIWPTTPIWPTARTSAVYDES